MFSLPISLNAHGLISWRWGQYVLCSFEEESKTGLLQIPLLCVQIPMMQGRLQDQQFFILGPTYTYNEIMLLLELSRVVEHLLGFLRFLHILLLTSSDISCLYSTLVTSHNQIGILIKCFIFWLHITSTW